GSIPEGRVAMTDMASGSRIRQPGRPGDLPGIAAPRPTPGEREHARRAVGCYADGESGARPPNHHPSCPDPARYLRHHTRPIVITAAPPTPSAPLTPTATSRWRLAIVSPLPMADRVGWGSSWPRPDEPRKLGPSATRVVILPAKRGGVPR